MGVAKIKDNILEYQVNSDYNTMVCVKQEIYLASAMNKWIFPGKIYTIRTCTKVSLPENSVAILTRYPYARKKIQVIPQIIVSDGFIDIQVQNIGFLPTTIIEEELLASLTIVQNIECHIVESKSGLV